MGLSQLRERVKRRGFSCCGPATNTATWEIEADQLKLKPIFEKFEAYTKPQNNQILSRYQLRCLKQDDMPLEEFLTKA